MDVVILVNNIIIILQEGKKKNWQPWDCMRIIMENVGAGESHGCPFRHHEGKILRKELEKGIKPAELDAIMKKVNEGHFQVFNPCQSVVRTLLPFDCWMMSIIQFW